ncbi:Rrf2 family transcriptional regulator [Caulobacter sp. CCG-8]|uniref:Rrf2 family transcriptional regulator n=1 Tax=Caulobacter sp. CCG-8 TaxID=3127958 RepID=UPI00307E62B6
MRLSTKGRYAVMAMTDLARQQDQAEGRAVALAEIAARQQISLSYLEQLFARLRRKGLVVSARGPGGGYRLAREARDTAIADIVLAVDEPLRATRCGVAIGAKGGKTAAKGCMAGGAQCLTHDLWEEMGRQIHGYLASVSVADVLDGTLRERALKARAGEMAAA